MSTSPSSSLTRCRRPMTLPPNDRPGATASDTHIHTTPRQTNMQP
jgi:hypothetical protein